MHRNVVAAVARFERGLSLHRDRIGSARYPCRSLPSLFLLHDRRPGEIISPEFLFPGRTLLAAADSRIIICGGSWRRGLRRGNLVVTSTGRMYFGRVAVVCPRLCPKSAALCASARFPTPGFFEPARLPVGGRVEGRERVIPDRRTCLGKS